MLPNVLFVRTALARGGPVSWRAILGDEARACADALVCELATQRVETRGIYFLSGGTVELELDHSGRRICGECIPFLASGAEPSLYLWLHEPWPEPPGVCLDPMTLIDDSDLRLLLARLQRAAETLGEPEWYSYTPDIEALLAGALESRPTPFGVS